MPVRSIRSTPGNIALNFLVIAIGGLLLIWPALRNQFPLVFGDTGTYLVCYEGSLTSILLPHVDRPDWYGGLLALFSANRWPWGVVIAQGLIGAALLRALVYAVGLRRPILFALLACLACAIATPLPLLISTLMPDVWLAFGFLAGTALCCRRTSFWPGMALLFVVFVAALVGTSHAVILAGTFFGLALCRVVMPLDLRRPVLVMGACVAAVLVLCLGNYKAYGHFRPLEGSQMFMFARFIQNGSVRKVLPEYCAKPDHASHSVCQNKAQLMRTKEGWEILWSPLAKKLDVWNDPYGDIRKINRTIERQQWKPFLIKSVVNSARLFAWQSDTDLRKFYRGPFREGSAPYYHIKHKYSPRVFKAFKSALQQSNDVSSPLVSVWLWLCWISAVGGLIYSVWLLVRGWFFKAVEADVCMLAALALGASLGNAIVSASLSGVVLRYEARTSAIVLPLMAACALLQYSRRRTRHTIAPVE
ncbi:hypothetical protein [Oleiagrimonas sp. C23AA]|uniref:hypothetical protein n=1 Tax=Oleiagrimonas sp. C23AA TaxID=2719047 RepID=UPI001424768B|nr:hypothetical protein [Oleiagrimonas sp. C23AA]NII12135.1 hypothetical protein [Oleiagrimonas sp. C23AA]